MTTIMTDPASGVLLAELEITKRCVMTCPSLCYAQAGPAEGHSGLSVADWLEVIDAVAARAPEGRMNRVQFIGGDPLLHPGIAQMIEHALGLGLGVEVATTLFKVSARMWAVLERPGVTIGVSYHSAVAAEHDRVTGRPGSHAATRANIAEAVRRGIPVRGQVVEVFGGQDAAGAEAELLTLGAAKVSRDRFRPVGNAAIAGREPEPSDLCGRCADGRLAVLADGSIAPCVLGRFLVAGNVTTDDLGEVITGQRWAGIREMVQSERRRSKMCGPADSNDCDPAMVLDLDEACPPADGNDCSPNDYDEI